MDFSNPDFWPNSILEPFQITSEPTKQYNCIAWAAGNDSAWFQPNHPYAFWPPEVPDEYTLDAYIKLYELYGYTVCDESNLDLEESFDKIVIYTDTNGNPMHAARQLECGNWTSKLGEDFDVRHTINAMSNGFYGNVAVVMRKIKQ